jgi:RNA recognition motif-containing protein
VVALETAGNPANRIGATAISNRVFVGNLNFSSTSDAVERFLSEAGEIREVVLPTDRATGRPRGFAFVEFATPEAAQQAIEQFDGQELDGRRLRVNAAEDRPPRRPSFAPHDDGPGFNDSQAPRGRISRPKGSRRGLRGKKRSL